MLVRKPAVAGVFYPADKDKLSSLLNRFLREGKSFYLWDKKKPKIIISPHAGINFSGPVAAWGYKNLARVKGIKNVILVGVSHNYFFNYGAVFGRGIWETPLGRIKINEKLAEKLIQTEGFKDDPSPHLPEHTLEMQLIFLQKIFTAGFKIIPVLFSQINNNLLAASSEVFAKLLAHEDTVMIISTDLSHYPDYQTANQVDSVTVESILKGKEREFKDWIGDIDKWRSVGVETLACGQGAVKIGLELANNLKLADRRYYHYANSGDISGEKERVVGYGSLGFYEGKQGYKVEALQLARRSLEFFMRTGKQTTIAVKNNRLKKVGGAFVTLKKQDHLRGCIGHIIGKESYHQSITDNVLQAAFHDPRFEPLDYYELNETTIEISLLSPLKKINNWRQIKLGRDGVVVKHGFASGVFLPQVGEEIKNLKEFLSLLCQEKAGLEPDCYQDLDTELYTFTADVFAE